MEQKGVTFSARRLEFLSLPLQPNQKAIECNGKFPLNLEKPLSDILTPLQSKTNLTRLPHQGNPISLPRWEMGLDFQARVPYPGTRKLMLKEPICLWGHWGGPGKRQCPGAYPRAGGH